MFRRKELRASFQHWLNSAPAWHVRLAAFLFGMVITLFALLLSELVQLLLHRPDA